MIFACRRFLRTFSSVKSSSNAEVDKRLKQFHTENKYADVIQLFRSDIMPDFSSRATPASCGRLMDSIHRQTQLQILKYVPLRLDIEQRKRFWLAQHRSVLKVWQLMKQHRISDIQDLLVIKQVVHSLTGMPFLVGIDSEDNDEKLRDPVNCTREALYLYQRSLGSDNQLKYPASFFDDLFRCTEWFVEVERAGAMSRFMQIFKHCINDHSDYAIRPLLIGQLSKLLVKESDFHSPQVIVSMLDDFVKLTGKPVDELSLDQTSFAFTRSDKLLYAEAVNTYLESCGSVKVSWARLETQLSRGMKPVEIKKRVNTLLKTAGSKPDAETLRNLYETAMKAFMKDDKMPISVKYEYMNNTYRDMIDRGVDPSIRSFSFFIDMYCRLQCGDSFKIAIFLFNSLLKDHDIQIDTSVNTKLFKLTSVTDIKNPVDRWNVMTIINAIERKSLGYSINSSAGYAFANVLIDGISFNNAMILMDGYIKQLRKRDVLSLNMYNSIIEAYARHQQPDTAFKYFKEAESKFGKSSITLKTVGSLVYQIKNPDARKRIVMQLLPDYRHVLPKQLI